MRPSTIFFDGACRLCQDAVRFIAERDRAARFQFLPLQSDAATAILSGGSDAAARPDTLVLLDHGRVFTKSTAALRIARHLRFPWPLVFLLVGIPRPLRDRIYDLAARHRHRWRGRPGSGSTCTACTPAAGSRPASGGERGPRGASGDDQRFIDSRAAAQLR